MLKSAPMGPKNSLTKIEKYHGLGNDFIVIEVEDPESFSVDRALRFTNRHFGVGADGVLLVSPAGSPAAWAKMSVINADGSTPEMCGNGLRCVALHLAKKKSLDSGHFGIETGAGLLQCELKREGWQATVSTDMGPGVHLGTLQHPGTGLAELAEPFEFERISTGNPHAICFREQISEALLDQLGPAVSGSILGGANVEIATLISPTQIKVTVWERGVGRTLACGTGAAATVIAAVRLGYCSPDSDVTVDLPGGSLSIRVDQASHAVLTGPAQWVYAAESAL